MQLIIPTATDAIELFFYSPGTIYIFSLLYIQRDLFMSGTKVEKGGRGVGRGDSVFTNLSI
jgi:hypothetical protein